MKVAIVHYHSGLGGVGAVIAAEAEALHRSGVRHVVLTGNSGDNSRHPSTGEMHEVPGLEYLTDTNHEQEPVVLEERLRTTAKDALGSPPDVWHFHNHSLGKNTLMAEVVARLAEAGERMILHIHDLAEDGRHANYANIPDPRRLYPFSPAIRYAFLNSRDLGVFTGAGLPRECAHLLENPVNPSAVPPPPSGDPLLFAPVRAIRRKNIGELVFLSALLPEGARIGVGRAPENPAALAIHNRWGAFAGNRRLPIGFDVVDRHSPVAGAPGDFVSWVTHSTHIISTSVAEGFGLAFLEAAAWGRPLVGRAIPHLVADHARHGIRAGWLYDGLWVPLDWIGANILRQHIRITVERNHRMLGRPLPLGIMDDVFRSLVREDWLDISNLPEALQQGVIERLRHPANHRVPLVRANGTEEAAIDWLSRVLEIRSPSADPQQLKPYALETYQENLMTLLQATVSAGNREPVRFVDPEDVLSAFSDPDSFHFLCSTHAPGRGAIPWRAVVFDIYGTLRIAPAGGVQPDTDADPLLQMIIRKHGYNPPESPSTTLHNIIRKHHQQAGIPHPEVDLRVIWREMLAVEPGTDITALVVEAEAAWHPSKPMPGAAECVGKLSRAGVSLGILSNAQCNSLPALGDIADLFAPELSILSYQHRMAKPSPELFRLLAERLAGRGISPAETLFVGNDPLQDIAPAAAEGFQTALFTGHPDSRREGACAPDITFTDWRQIC